MTHDTGHAGMQTNDKTNTLSRVLVLVALHHMEDTGHAGDSSQLCNLFLLPIRPVPGLCQRDLRMRRGGSRKMPAAPQILHSGLPLSLEEKCRKLCLRLTQT